MTVDMRREFEFACVMRWGSRAEPRMGQGDYRIMRCTEWSNDGRRCQGESGHEGDDHWNHSASSDRSLAWTRDTDPMALKQWRRARRNARRCMRGLRDFTRFWFILFLALWYRERADDLPDIAVALLADAPDLYGG